MSIREATLNDVEAILPLFDAYRVFYEQTSDLDGAAQCLKENLSCQRSHVFVFEDNETVLGFTQLYPAFCSVAMQPFFVLYDLYVSGLHEISEDSRIHDRGVRVQVVGRLGMLPKRVRDAISHAEEVTSQYSDFTFTVCLAYGGREEIIDAVKSVAVDHASGNLDIDSIDSSEINNRMYASELPDPDLVIRTSGEERISNFLLWQIAYSELHFSDVFWPSFSKSDLYEAIESYQQRRRRYGG